MRPPRIVIVGAGVAGLTLAAALDRRGLRCSVFERAAAPIGSGAGIQLSPNATRLLGRLGLGGALDAVALRPVALEFRGWRDNEPIGRTELGRACEDRYGAPYYTMHRADLHRVLREHVGGVVHSGWRCVGVRDGTGEAVVRFADGTTVAADLVVGADGIRSTVRAALGLAEARYSGLTAYRAFGTIERAPAPDVVLWMGPGQHAIRYPVAPGDEVNIVAMTPARCWEAGSWTVPARSAELLAAYRDWHPEVRAVLAAAGRVTRWALLDAPPGTRLHAGRVAVIGDAAYPMLPFGAQGANQAIEDAVALAACLDGVGRAGVPEALARYGEVRLPRRTRVGEFVRDNARSHHLRDREIGADHGLPGRDWLYGYDAERAVRGSARCA